MGLLKSIRNEAKRSGKKVLKLTTGLDVDSEAFKKGSLKGISKQLTSNMLGVDKYKSAMGGGEADIPDIPEAKKMPIAGEEISISSRRKARARQRGSRSSSNLSGDTLG